MAGVELSLHGLTLKGRLQNINGQIPAGRMTCIVGPNGAGKSSLLYCLSGLLPLDGQQVQLNGSPLQDYDVRALARLRAYLPQQINRELGFRGAEVLGMACYTGQGASESYLHGVIRLLDLAPLLPRVLSELSGGECQRLQIARTLLQILSVNPQGLLLLDEPLSGLDIQYQLRLMQYLHSLAAEGCTVVLALHDLNLARLYGHEVWLLQEGHLLARGAPEQVLSSERIAQVFHVPLQLVQGQLLWPQPG